MFEVTKARTAVGLLAGAAIAVAAPSAGARTAAAIAPAAASTAAGAGDASGGYEFSPAQAPAPLPAATRIVEVRSSGFDWQDAGLGAAAMLSLLGLGTGAVVVARRGRPTMG
jgi:hypothetical protein